MASKIRVAAALAAGLVLAGCSGDFKKAAEVELDPLACEPHPYYRSMSNCPGIAGSYLNAVVAEKQRDWERASREFEQIIATKRDTPFLLQQAARAALFAGEFDTAVKHAQKLRGGGQGDALTALVAAADAARSGKMPVARDILVHAAGAGNNDALSLVLRFVAEEMRNNPAKPAPGLGDEDVFIQALRTAHDKHLPELFNKAIEAGDMETAGAIMNGVRDATLLVLTVAHGLLPEDSEFAAQIADMAKEDKNLLLAVKFLERAGAHDAEAHIMAQTETALLLHESGDKLSAYHRLDKLEKNNVPEERFARAVLFERDGNHVAAAEILDRLAVQENIASVSRAQIFYRRGLIHARHERPEAAEDDYRRALDAMKIDDDGRVEILNALGYSLAVRGKNLHEAAGLIEEAMQLNVSNNGDIAVSMGWILYRRGEYTQAVEYLEAAVNNDGRMAASPRVADHLADALWKTGRGNEARMYWNFTVNELQRRATEGTPLSAAEQSLAEAARRKLSENFPQELTRPAGTGKMAPAAP